jgi:hypothetical protein
MLQDYTQSIFVISPVVALVEPRLSKRFAASLLCSLDASRDQLLEMPLFQRSLSSKTVGNESLDGVGSSLLMGRFDSPFDALEVGDELLPDLRNVRAAHAASINN